MGRSRTRTSNERESRHRPSAGAGPARSRGVASNDSGSSSLAQSFSWRFFRSRRNGWRGRPAPERQGQGAAENSGGEGRPAHRRSREGGEAEERVEGVMTGARERERRCGDAVEQRDFDAVRRREQPVWGVNADRGHDHDREHQGRTDGAQETQHHQDAAPNLTDCGDRGEEAPREEPEGFQYSADASQAGAPEPSEEFLRTVRRHEEPQHEPEDEQSRVHESISFLGTSRTSRPREATIYNIVTISQIVTCTDGAGRLSSGQ